MNLPPAPTVIGRICIDLDNTLATSQWPSPEIGEPIETGVNIVLAAIDEGYEVIIYTARPASHSHRIWEWLKENGLYGVVYDVVCGKPTADLYVDDKAYNPFQGAGAAPPGKDQGPTQSKAAGSYTPFQGEFGPIDEDWWLDRRVAEHQAYEEEPDDAWVERMLRGAHG